MVKTALLVALAALFANHADAFSLAPTAPALRSARCENFAGFGAVRANNP